MDKGNLGVPQLPGQGCSFHSFRTNTYKLSFMESPSGIKVSEFHVDYDVLTWFLWEDGILNFSWAVMSPNRFPLIISFNLSADHPRHSS